MPDDGLLPPPRLPGLPSLDHELVDAIRDGDRKATARLVEIHADAVYRFVYHRIDRLEALDDLVQDVFLAAWKALPLFRGESEIRTWLLGIARHKIGDYYRGRLREPIVSDNLDSESGPASLAGFPDIDARLDGERLEAKTRQALSTLPDQYKAVLIWRYWDQRSLAEMAAISGNTEKSIERLLDRARRLFKKRWDDG